MTTCRSGSRLLGEAGVRSGAASAALVLALAVAAAVRLGPLATEVLVAVVVAASSVALDGRFALGVGALGWALYSGFVVHRYGELTLTAADLLRLAVFACVATTVAWGTRPTMTSFVGDPSADVLGLKVPVDAVSVRQPRR
jgi:hypothetical protein